jgi:hypothetical protein
MTQSFAVASPWQMHPGMQADAEFPQDRWNHLKIVFKGPRAELYKAEGGSV